MESTLLLFFFQQYKQLSLTGSGTFHSRSDWCDWSHFHHQRGACRCPSMPLCTIELTSLSLPHASLTAWLLVSFFFFFSLRGLNTLPDIKGTSCRWWWIRPHKLWDKLLLLTTPTPSSQVVTCCLLSIKVAVIFGNSYCVVWRVNLTLSSTNQSLFPAELDKQRT